MIKVSRIAVQKKNKGRYNIFIEKDGEEEYGFSLEEETLINESLSKGQLLEQETVDRLMTVDDLNKAYSRALNYLSYRMRSTKEIIDYLSEKEIDQEQINRIVSRLKEQNLLDDQAFADAFVGTKMNTTLNGPERFKSELYQKGIKEELINRALQKYTETEQISRIRKWLKKQTKKTTRHSHRQGLIKMEQQLMRKGFGRSIIKDAFEEASLEKDDKEEWQALVYQGEKALRRYQAKSEDYTLRQKVKAALYRKGFTKEQIEQFVEQYVKSKDLS